MLRIFITGAGGYLGSTFLSCIPDDWDVIALGLNEPTVRHPKNFTFIKGNLTDDALIFEHLEDVDLVLHFAAVKGSDKSLEQPSETIEVNVLGTHILLKNALRRKVKRFIFPSTYWIYGNSTPPFKEETPVQPFELYGLSKAISEIEISRSEIDYVILRFSNIFGLGSGIRPDEVIFNFIKSAFEGEPLQLHGGGKQKLDFIKVDDVCKYLMQVTNEPKISRTILNIGSGKPTSISSVAQIISNIFKKNYGKEILIKSLPGAQPYDRWVSISKLEKVLCNLNVEPIETSIESYIRDYKKMIYDSSSKTFF